MEEEYIKLEMHIIRPIKKKDFPSYKELAFAATLGLLSLPKDPKVLKERIEKSVRSFAKQGIKPNDELYIFVLEEVRTGKVVGTSALVSKSAIDHPKYFYRLGQERKMEILTPVAHRRGDSEMTGLFLHPKNRKGGLGKLLSLHRFLFIAGFPHLFENKVIAELRGPIQPDFTSPFWDGVGNHFSPMSFEQALTLFEQEKLHIPDLLPKYPLYLSLLPEKTRKVVGKTHRNTRGARKMLESEGFTFSGEVDIFDAGPKMEAVTKKMRTLRNSKVATVGKILSKSPDGTPYLLTNESKDFRACFGEIEPLQKGKIALTAKIAKALQLEVGSLVRYVDIS